MTDLQCSFLQATPFTLQRKTDYAISDIAVSPHCLLHFRESIQAVHIVVRVAMMLCRHTQCPTEQFTATYMWHVRRVVERRVRWTPLC